MRTTPERRFTIADAMILVCAAAVAAVLVRSVLPALTRPGWSPGAASRAYGWARTVGSCVVVPGMAAMIAIRLRRPRPSWTRLSFQPGFVACLAVIASLAPGLAMYASIRHRPGFQTAPDQVWFLLTHWSRTAVLGAWLALYLSRRWRREPSWVDRTGRGLGLYWIVLLIAQYAIQAWRAFA